MNFIKTVCKLETRTSNKCISYFRIELQASSSAYWEYNNFSVLSKCASDYDDVINTTSSA